MSIAFGGRPPLVLLSGWGVDAGAWSAVVECLAGEFDVHCLDLPDLPGERALAQDGRDAPALLARWCEDLLARAPDGANWLGWSLGGNLALALAGRYPERISSVAAVASAPRFVAGRDWPGVDSAVLDDFATALSTSPAGLARRFLGLSAYGCREARRALSPVGSAVSLEQGLYLLRHLDLRQELAGPAVAGYMMSEVDGVVPPAIVRPMAQLLGARLRLISGCHALMVSHPEEVSEFARDCFCR
ncbi:MAG: alpha/beta fold hydrolase [Pseudomonadota bacterium]